MTPDQERRTVDLLTRSVALLASLLAETRDLATSVQELDLSSNARNSLGSRSYWSLRRSSSNLRNLAIQATPLLDAAEELAKELGHAE